MTDRSRIRRGRDVSYWPTAAEETASGAGPWPAMISRVNADGTVDIVVDTPAAATVGAAVADPLIAAAALAAFTDPPSAAEMALLRTLVNELRTDVIALAQLVNQLRTDATGGRKAGVRIGGERGQCSLTGESDFV